MASEYTTNFNLDLYTDTDKPNLRDQYNGAMNKIDAQLRIASNNNVIATETANQAKDMASAAQSAADTNAKSIAATNATVAGIDSAYKAADTKLSDDIAAATNGYKEADTKLSADITSAYKAADVAVSSSRAPVNHASNETTYGIGDESNYGHVKLYNAIGTDTDGAITPAAVQSALSNINTSIEDGSITTQKIADGAVTAAKIAQSAKDSIIGGMTIKVFGNKITGTDNTGASYPDKMEMAGAYIPALDILIIWRINIENGSSWSETNPLVLPSYVPSMRTFQTSFGGVEWSSSNDFIGWNALILSDRKIYVNKTMDNNFSCVPIVISCAPYRNGDTTTII